MVWRSPVKLWHQGAAYYRSATALQKALLIAGSALFVVMLVHLAALVLSGGPLSGPVSFRKPATFAETGWLMCWSAAYFLPLVPLKRGERGLIVTGVLLFALGETLIAMIQAWRGEPFHYNESSPLSAALFYLGGLESLVLFAAVLAWLFALRRRQTLPPSLLLALRGGLVFLLAGTLIGYLMILNASGIWQGLGRWQTHGVFQFYSQLGAFRTEPVGGNLVVLHAIAVHGLSLLPLAAWLLTYSRLPERQRTRLVAGLLLALTALFLTLGVQALRLRPLGQFDPLTLAVLLVSAAVFLGLYVVVVLALGRKRILAP